MKRKKGTRFLLTAMLMLASLGCAADSGQAPSPDVLPTATPEPVEQRAVFSWYTEVLEPEERKTLVNILKVSGANTLYQNFYKAEPALAASFLNDMAREGIRVYGLLGDPGWALPQGLTHMCQQIEALRPLMQPEQGALCGVMLDVEPGQLPEWKADAPAVMDGFVQNMAAAYALAKSTGMEVLLCIPTTFDKFPEALETLIGSCCDGVAVMNYVRKNAYARIETEAALALNHGKQLINVSELQEPGQHGLTPKNTYYGLGLEALLSDWQALREALGETPVTFAYHDYDALRCMLELE